MPIEIPVAARLIELAIVLVLGTWRPAWCSQPSSLLLWSTLAISVWVFSLPFLGEEARRRGFVPLAADEMAAALAVVAAYISPPK